MVAEPEAPEVYNRVEWAVGGGGLSVVTETSLLVEPLSTKDLQITFSASLSSSTLLPVC